MSITKTKQGLSSFLIAATATIFATLSSATGAQPSQNSQSVAPIRPKVGTVVYEGTYSGESVKSSRLRTSEQELEGAITITVNFNNDAVKASYTTTGLLRGNRVSGLLQGDVCKLYQQTGALMEGGCTATYFDGTLQSSPTDRKQITVSFKTKAVKVDDFAVRQQRNNEMAQQRKAEAIAAMQLPDPDVSSADLKSQPTKKLNATLSNIDDVGFVLIKGPDDKWNPLIMAEWNSGTPGSAKDSLSSKLATGQNIVILGVHNKSFQFGPGRWTYQFELEGDKGSIWSKSGGAMGGGVGIRYWRVFAVTKQKNSMLLVSEATPEQVETTKNDMKRFNELLIEKFGIETSSMGMAINSLVSSAMSGGQSSRSSGDGADSMAFERDQRNRQEAENASRAQQEAANSAYWQRIQTPDAIGR